MKWTKLGIVERPRGTQEAISHCYLPTPILLESQNVIRVYYSSWDINSRGRIFYTDFDADNPMKVVERSDGYILNIGEPGTFDCDGVMPSCAYLEGNKIYLTYSGFQRTVHTKVTVILSGIAYSEINNKNVVRWASTPFLERTSSEPFFRSVPFLRIDGKYVRAWYTSSISGWRPCKDKRYWNAYPLYDIGYIQSTTMLGLQKPTRILCNIRRANELGVSRPWILKDDFRYRMWFSYRREDLLYRIGYAESLDGIYWSRFDDKVGLQPDTLYDSEMMAFPALLKVGNEIYIYYNGNNHGAEGVALARLEQD